jgi:hypothetical protein
MFIKKVVTEEFKPTVRAEIATVLEHTNTNAEEVPDRRFQAWMF